MDKDLSVIVLSNPDYSTGMIAPSSKFPSGTAFCFRKFLYALLAGLALMAGVSGVHAQSAPSAPVNVFAQTGATTATVSWTRVGLGASEFVVEQLADTLWVPAGTAPADATSLLLTGLTPDTFYNFRVTAKNSTGSASSQSTFTKTKPAGFGTVGIFSDVFLEHAGVRFFTFTDPPAIRRFRLSDRTWLPDISLAKPVKSVWADDAGIYAIEQVADQTVVGPPLRIMRWNPDGTQMNVLAESPTEGFIATAGDILVLGRREELRTYDKRTGILLRDSFVAALTSSGPLYPVSLQPQPRIYFTSTPSAGYTQGYAELSPDGSVLRSERVQDFALRPSGPRMFLFPRGDLVADEAGNIFLTETLSHVHSLGTSVKDLAFAAPDLPVVLTPDRLRGFSSSLGETGSAALPAPDALGVGVSGTDAALYFRDATASCGIRVEYVPLTALNLPAPGLRPDPAQLDFPVDDLVQGGDGTVYVLSRRHRAVFRWSPALRGWLPDIPLAGGPVDLDWDPVSSRLLTAYPQGRIGIIDPVAAAPAESFLPGSRLRLASFEPAGTVYFTDGDQGVRTISTADGSRVSSPSFSASEEAAFDPRRNRIYTLSGYHMLDAGGAFTGSVSISGSRPPAGASFRFRADGEKIAVSSGQIFTPDLIQQAALPAPVSDTAWLGTRLASLSPAGTAFSRVRTWTDALTPAGEVYLDGTPLRALTLADGSLLIVTRCSARTCFHVLSPALEPQFSSHAGPPAIVSQPQAQRVGFRETIRLSADVAATPGLLIQWYLNDTPIPGATGLVLEIPAAGSLDAGNYRFTATNGAGTASSAAALISVGPAREFFTAGNLLVGHVDRIFEYTPDGNLVKTMQLPAPIGGQSPDILDLAIDGRGLLHVARSGRGEDFLTSLYLHTWDPDSGTWTAINTGRRTGGGTTFPLAAGDNFVVTPRGIYRPPSQEATLLPLTPQFQYYTFCLRPDGMLTGAGDFGRIATLDLANPQWSTPVQLQGMTNAPRMACAADGGVIAVSFRTSIHHFAPDGSLIRSAELAAPTGSVDDVDVAPSGRIAVGFNNGKAMLVDPATLQTLKTLNVSDSSAAAVAWVPLSAPLEVVIGDTAPLAALEDQDFSWEIPASYPDPDALLSVSADRLPAWLRIDGTRLVGRPLQADTGTFAFNLRVEGPDGKFAIRAITGEAIAVNDAPQGTAMDLVRLEDAPAEELLLSTLVTDEESAVLSFEILSGNDQAVSASIAGGRLRISYKPDQNGNAEIRVRGSDPEGLSGDAIIRISVTPVNDPPRLARPVPDISAGAVALDAVINPGDFFSDPDADDVLRWEVVRNTNPAIFSALSVDADGRLQLSYAPFLRGISDMTIRATDSDGTFAEASFTVDLPALPAPVFSASGGPVLNRQTGLFEQKVTVRNAAQRAIGGFEISAAGLAAETCLYNASDCLGPLPLVGYYVPIQPGAEVEVVLEYYSPQRRVPTPVLAAQTALPHAPAAATHAGMAVDRILPLGSAAVLLEFPSVPGALYTVQYSSDAATWKDSPIRVRAGGTRLQWIDRGAPKTDSPPLQSGTSRFYRVARLAGG